MKPLPRLHKVHLEELTSVSLSCGSLHSSVVKVQGFRVPFPAHVFYYIKPIQPCQADCRLFRNLLAFPGPRPSSKQKPAFSHRRDAQTYHLNGFYVCLSSQALLLCLIFNPCRAGLVIIRNLFTHVKQLLRLFSSNFAPWKRDRTARTPSQGRQGPRQDRVGVLSKRTRVLHLYPGPLCTS